MSKSCNILTSDLVIDAILNLEIEEYNDLELKELVKTIKSQTNEGKLPINDKVLSMRKIDAVSQAAWTTGRLVFVNEKLFDILKTIGKKYDVQILVQSRKVYTEYFSGSIDTNLTLDEILSYLDVDNKFMWRKKGKTIVITAWKVHIKSV